MISIDIMQLFQNLLHSGFYGIVGKCFSGYINEHQRTTSHLNFIAGGAFFLVRAFTKPESLFHPSFEGIAFYRRFEFSFGNGKSRLPTVLRFGKFRINQQQGVLLDAFSALKQTGNVLLPLKAFRFVKCIFHTDAKITD